MLHGIQKCTLLARSSALEQIHPRLTRKSALDVAGLMRRERQRHSARIWPVRKTALLHGVIVDRMRRDASLDDAQRLMGEYLVMRAHAIAFEIERHVVETVSLSSRYELSAQLHRTRQLR